MGHDEISDCLARILRSCGVMNRLLDIGCGDAELASRALKNGHVRLREYHGVDLASEPLEFAQEKLLTSGVTTHFHQQDQLEFISTNTLQFDAVLLGFALHHNSSTEKASFLKQVRSHLAPKGIVILYDVFRREQETRDDFFGRYLAWIHETWDKMTHREYQLLADHIRSNDRPDPVESVQQFALDAGFTSSERMLDAAAEFHSLLLLST